MRILKCPKCDNVALVIKNTMNQFTEIRRFYGVCEKCNHMTREYYSVVELIKSLN